MFPVQTDVTINASQPDIVYAITNETFLIDISVPSAYNIGQKEKHELNQYHQLQNEIKRVWKTETKIVPLGASGVNANSI